MGRRKKSNEIMEEKKPGITVAEDSDDGCKCGCKTNGRKNEGECACKTEGLENEDECEGEICYINTKDKTIRLRKSNGVVLNLFRYRSTSYYIFSKVSPGEQSIYWNGNFNFNVTLLSERGEPKWT